MYKSRADDELFELKSSEFSTYPKGIIVLERDGTVVEYNEAEQLLARREGIQTVGLNFWTDVAPCTAVQEFKGRFDHFAASRESAVERFDFFFRFAWGTQHVGIAMIRKMGQDPITLLVTVKDS